MPEKIMLIDGNSIINRAFYALPPLSNKDGEFTNGVYGFLNIFFKLYDEVLPQYVIAAFDLPAPTARHIKYEQYKGTRKSMPMELRPQIPLLKELLSKMNIPVYALEGYEADDLLGTLAVKAEQAGMSAVVVSGDRDLLQIASDKIQIKIPKTKGGNTIEENYFSKDVMETYGVTPKEFIDVKALMGDASDNVPGVPGIGEKTALKIITQYKSLENAIAHAADIKPKKAAENIIAYEEQAILSKDLVTIMTDAPVDLPEKQLTAKEMYNNEALMEIRRLDFKSHLSRFSKAEDRAAKNTEEEKTDYCAVDTAGLAVLLPQLMAVEVLAVDFVRFNGVLCGISLSHKKGAGRFIGFDDGNTNVILEMLKPLLESGSRKIMLDSKQAKVFLRRHGVHLNNVVFDCNIAAYVLNASNSTYNYNDIARDYLDKLYPSAEELSGKGRGKLSFNDLPLQDQIEYGCRQADTIYAAYPIMERQLKDNAQEELYYEIELPLIDILVDMEILGIKVHKDALMAYDQLLTGNIDILTSEIYELAGEEFNINSPIQLGDILFAKLGLQGGKKTKRGYSTAADVLEKLRYAHPIVDKILVYRTLSKLKSTYCDGLLNVMDEKTHKIHSTFNQTITATGRISSTEPNLQNIPIRMEIGRELRKVFIPSDETYLFADADYSQIELRVLAHISGDETMIEAYRNGADIHRITASQVLKIPPEEVTQQQRNSAKAVNFGIVYGISGYSLSQDLGITKKEADNYIKAYFEKYPKVRAYMDHTIKDARENGYVSTIFNRRRNVPELMSSNFAQRSFGERVAMNMPIQGSAADIMKIAMIRVYKRLKAEELESRIILQVHDELLLEVKRTEVDRVVVLLKEEMASAVDLLVPMETDVHTGETWYEAK